MLQEGWYLMSPADVEAELPYVDDPSRDGPVSDAVRLGIEEALAYKHGGNLPDAQGRSLRLVLRAPDPDPESIAVRRVRFEPDYHEAPEWRREGSKPINVIPLRGATKRGAEAWWNDPTMSELEAEWQAHGTVGGVVVPGEYRSFVHKTVVALRASGREVSASSIADSISRWVPASDAEAIRAALLRANAE